jgi:phosphoribulokinase
MSKPSFDRPIILGIVGDSAAGKTTLSRGVAEILGLDRCTLICTDDYHRYDRRERAANGVSALDPAGNYVDILEQHLHLLRSGQPILKPVYNHDTGALDRPEYVEPKEFVVAEGLLGYATRAMRDCYDVKIYLDPEEDLRVRWKVHRDTSKRGYTAEQVLESLKKRMFDSPTFIRPQRLFADIVIRFQRPPGANAQAANPETDHRLDVAHILRPTLPHPNFSRLIEAWLASRCVNCSTTRRSTATACRPSTSTIWSRRSRSWRRPPASMRRSSSRPRAARAPTPTTSCCT